MSEAVSTHSPPASDVHAGRLFRGSCVALISGAAMFAISGDIIGALKQTFVLTNEQVGFIMSGASWGFMVSIVVLGPLCDWLRMRNVLRLALVSHLVGVALMVFATGFWTLFIGMLVNAIGSGAIEAACNPLIATVYPDRKTEKLSQFHIWFPGGIVLGGLACYALRRLGLDYWQLKVALVVPVTLAYGVMFAGQTFPATERVQSGVSFGGMVRETLFRPLFLVLLFCMMLTASLELGPQRWIPSVLQAGGVPGILVLVWITGLMAVLRQFGGVVSRAFSNSGVLLLSAILSGIGLAALSFASGIVAVGIAATIFAVGVCYFWPTMLGTVAERVPKGGAFALSLLGGLGGMFVGVVTVPLMGAVADGYLHRELVREVSVDGKTLDRSRDTVAALQAVADAYAAWSQSLGTDATDQVTRAEIGAALETVRDVLARAAEGGLPEEATANALRIAIKNGPARDVAHATSDAERSAAAAKAAAAAVLNPAENRGGLMAFRYVAPVSVLLAVVFGIMLAQDRRRAKAGQGTPDAPAAPELTPGATGGLPASASGEPPPPGPQPERPRR